MLRRLLPKDAPRMLEWMKEPRINHFFRWNPKKVTLETVIAFIEKASMDTSDIHRAVVNDEDVYMGTISLKDINKDDSNAEYAISLHMDAIGKRYARTATDEILHLAFVDLGLQRVHLNVRHDNIRARRFYEKYGFIYEGTLRKHLKKDGNFYDLDLFSILREEYNAAGN